MYKKRISTNEYYLELEKCVSCMSETPTLQNLLDTRKENHATSIIVSTKNNKNLFKGDISGLPEELLNIPIFSWDKKEGIYIYQLNKHLLLLSLWKKEDLVKLQLQQMNCWS